MSRLNIIFSILFIALTAFKCCFCQSFSEIFSPSPFFVKGLQNVEDTMQQVEISTQAGLLFLAIGMEGITVLDLSTNKVLGQFQNLGEVDIFSITADGKYIFFSYQGRISIFTVQKSPTIQLQYVCSDMSSDGLLVNQLYLFNNENWAAAASSNFLVVYDITQKNSFKTLGRLDTGMNPFYFSNIVTSNLFLVNTYLKVVRFKLDSQNNLQLSVIFVTPADYAFSSIIITQDQQYIYAIDSWGGLYFGTFINLDAIPDGATEQNFSFSVTSWWPTNQSPLPNEMKITKDENFIIVGVQQLGIYIFDISNRKTNIYPVLFQWIRSTGYSFSVRLSQDQNFLYYVNGMQLQVYEKVTPNLNNVYPNLFNVQQANFTVVGTNIYRWRCYVTRNDQYLVGSFDKDGLFVLNMNGNPNNMQILQDVVPQNIYFTESAIIDEDSGYIITPGDSTGILLFVYQINQIQSTQNLQPVAQLNNNDPTIEMEGIIYNNNKKFIGIAAYTSVFLVDSSQGPLSMKVLSSIYLNTNIVELVFTKDNKYMLAASRNYGFVCIQIGSNYQLSSVSQLKTNGGFSIIQSLDQNYAFVSEGPKGIGVIDLNQLPKIQFISRVSVDGTTMHILPIQQDNFFLVSSNVQGFLTLVDARNKTNLVVISKFLVTGQNGLSSCVNSNQSYAMLTNGAGITSLPIVSKVLAHTEIFQVLGRETNKITYLRQQSNQILLIGQQFQFQFYQIYPINGASLTSILYYQNYQIVNLPYWIVFDSQLGAANIQAVKDALGNDVTVPQMNTIILQFKIPLTSNSFEFDTPTDDGVVISNALSKQIFQQLRQMQVIGYDNLVIDTNFESKEDFRFLDQTMNTNQPLLDKVKRIIQQSIFYNPVMFKVSNSLRFFTTPQPVPEYAQQNGNNSTTSYFVFSIQNDIQLYLEVQKGVGQFVDIYYDGVIAQISNYQTHLKLEGNVQNINAALSNRILFFKQNALLSNDEVIFSITLTDGVNYDIEASFSLTQASQFIQLKEQIVLNKSKTLQEQFNQMFSGGQVAISDNLAFEFSPDTFLVSDIGTINYVATYKRGGDYVNSVSGAWIQQSTNSLRFFGTVPIDEFRDILNVKIVASDGYTSTEDTFNIYVYNIPFVYILSTFIKIFGPIITILGIYRYRSYFFNYAFGKKNLYKKETVEIFSNYYKKITIMSDENIKAKLFLKALFKHIKIGKRSNKQASNVSINLDHNPNENISPEYDPYFKLNIPNFLKRPEQNFNEFLYSQIFDKQAEHALSDKQSSQESFLKLTLQRDSKIKDILTKIVDILNNNQNGSQSASISIHNKNKDEEYPCKQDGIQMKNIKNDDQTENLSNENKLDISLNSYLRKHVMNESGKIQMKFLIKQMVDSNICIKHVNQAISVKAVISELVDSSSRLYQSIKALVSRYLLKNEPILYLIYKFLKRSSIVESKIGTGIFNDWYLKYLITIPEENENEQKLLSFPKVQLQIDHIKSQVKLMVSMLHSYKKFTVKNLETLRNSNFPYKLLYNVLIADSLGLVNKQPSIFKPSQGESIHSNFFEINSVQAYKKVDILQCFTIRRFLKLDVMNYGSSKNQQLPSWMKFTLKSNAIVLSGVPKLQDVETVIIRIQDVSDYIIREFEVEITKPNESSPSNMKKLNELREEDIQEDGVISPTESVVTVDNIKLENVRNALSINQDSFFSSCQINHENLRSPESNQYLQFAKQMISQPTTLREQESPIVNAVITTEFQIKQK